MNAYLLEGTTPVRLPFDPRDYVGQRFIGDDIYTQESIEAARHEFIDGQGNV